MSNDKAPREILIDPAQREVFTRIVQADDTTSFTELASWAGLDPASAFRFSNLSGADFSDCDLSGFDFTGADLTGADFTRAKYDDAVFKDAIITGVRWGATDPRMTTDDSLDLTAWYDEMSPKEKRGFWACTGGWALDAMDVQMFSFAIPAIAAYFSLSNAAAGSIATVTLFTSAFGGWFAGALSDRFSRVRTLQITILWFAVFAFLSGFAQNYTQLFVSRALMGLGFGGEWAAAAVLVGEMIRSPDRGKAVGTMQSGWAVGWGFAALMATLLLNTLPTNLTADPADRIVANVGAVDQPDVIGFAVWAGVPAWRWLFVVGLLPALLVFFVRRFVDEPAVFEDTRKNLASAGRKANILEIFFSPDMRRTTILTCLLATGAHGGYHAIMTWLPKFLREERHLTVLGTGGYFSIVIAGSLFGYLISAWLSDHIGRRPNFILFAACAIVTVGVYTQIPVNDSIMMLLGFPLGFFASSVFSGIGPFFTELFPTRMRGSGQGFAYSFGRGLAAFNPLLVGLVSASLPLGQSIGVLALIAYGLMILAALLLPETKGRVLTTEAAGFPYPLTPSSPPPSASPA
jgi:MFS family permease